MLAVFMLSLTLCSVLLATLRLHPATASLRRGYEGKRIMATIFENSGLYSLKEVHNASMAPMRTMANMTKQMFSNPLHPLAYTTLGRQFAAAGELVERITQSYPKPEFGLKHTTIDGKNVEVWEEVVLEKPFCKLRRFKRNSKLRQEKLLIVRDSYMDSMAPFLTADFSELHLIDPRYYKQSLNQYIEEHDIDRVLICMSLSSYMESTGLPAVLR